jgi:hypothetical protein
MIAFIETARTQLKLLTPRRPVRTLAEYAVLQEQYVGRARAEGRTLVPRTVTVAVPARIDGGAWVISCTCGDAPLVDPAWTIGRCLYCGDVYTQVVFPAQRAALEAILLKRPNPATRHTTDLTVTGRVEHSVDFLRAENLAHGVEVP